MNRNTESHFSVNPINLDIQRSKFVRPSTHKTTFNAGNLIPIYVDEVLPGDTFKMNMSSVIRMSTPIYPVMDNANLDVYFFFVPNRLVWDHWKEFFGENNTTHWEQPVEYEVPQITAPTGGWAKGTIADYMGIPTKIENISVQALPFRAYCKIWNDWFRDQNLKDPAMISMDETTTAGANTGDYVTNAEKGALPLKVAKYHDYFTAALPEPQKGPEVNIGGMTGYMPVVTREESVNLAQATQNLRWKSDRTGTDPLLITMAGTNEMNQDGTYPTKMRTLQTTVAGAKTAIPANLWVDMTNSTATSINALRQAFAIQRLYEKNARGGTRYIEIIKAHFGVQSPDARQQRSEYLGGTRVPINMDQVVQTSNSGDGITPQGNTAAYSLTAFNESMFTKSFTEHGYIIGLACIRTEHTYQQGIERFWSRKKMLDYYFPTLANLGEQAILNKEIYAQGNATDDEAFGYQEAWAEYRYKPSRVSGAMRSNYQATLDAWHYADKYSQQPILSSEWIDETSANIDRTLAVQSTTEDQFIADFYFACEATRPMPLYSIPGLIDHH
ncbi:VP1 [Gokushovirus WZ-2015a]|nr:VP1 [Gokushovirus WZ-2015a]UYL95745.1 MAG: major capsid protein [Microviridae sp.]